MLELARGMDVTKSIFGLLKSVAGVERCSETRKRIEMQVAIAEDRKSTDFHKSGQNT